MELEQHKTKRFLFGGSTTSISNGKTKYFINTQMGYGSYANIYNILYSVSENVNDLEKHVSPRCIKVFKKSAGYTEYAKNEVLILSKIKHPTLFVSVFDTFMYNEHFCIISNRYDLNLYQYIKKSMVCKTNIQTICKQLLKGLIYLKTKHIIHGDLKPENILVNIKNESVTTCAICDFNLAIDTTKHMTHNDTDVTTLWYRAPEVYLDIKFSYEMDIWAFGCILYELITNKPLFRPTCTNDNIQNNKGLYEQHLSLIGKCPFKLLEDYGSINLDNKIIFDPKIFKTGYQTVFSECIKWDPKKRMVPEGCLKYIREMIDN